MTTYLDFFLLCSVPWTAGAVKAWNVDPRIKLCLPLYLYPVTPLLTVAIGKNETDQKQQQKFNTLVEHPFAFITSNQRFLQELLTPLNR